MRNKHEIIIEGGDPPEKDLSFFKYLIEQKIEQKSQELKDLAGFSDETGEIDTERWTNLTDEDKKRIDELKYEIGGLRKQEVKSYSEQEEKMLSDKAEEVGGESKMPKEEREHLSKLRRKDPNFGK